MMLVLETPRLCLRRFGWADLDELAQISADPANRRYMNVGPLTRAQTAANIREWLADYPRGFGFFAVVGRADDLLLGQCGLTPEASGDVDLGYLIDHPHWGRGLATEVARAVLDYGFGVLRCGRIRAGAHRDNEASQRVMQKIGLLRAVSADAKVRYALTAQQWAMGTTAR
jgi:RimJ/RimL family protein N-acetyltransferase